MGLGRDWWEKCKGFVTKTDFKSGCLKTCTVVLVWLPENQRTGGERESKVEEEKVKQKEKNNNNIIVIVNIYWALTRCQEHF